MRVLGAADHERIGSTDGVAKTSDDRGRCVFVEIGIEVGKRTELAVDVDRDVTRCDELRGAEQSRVGGLIAKTAGDREDAHAAKR